MISMSNKGTPIDPEIIKQLRLKEKLSQEKLSDKSFYENCYISLSTLKRIEKGCLVSNSTLQKLSTLFKVNANFLIKHDKGLQNRHQTTIYWDKISTLPNTHKYKKLLSLCKELQTLLHQNLQDKQLNSIFHHHIK